MRAVSHRCSPQGVKLASERWLVDAQRVQVRQGERIRVAAIDRRIAGLQPQLAAIGELPEPIQADRVAIGAGLHCAMKPKPVASLRKTAGSISQ